MGEGNRTPRGWVRGPAIHGEVIAPSGDWLHVLPGGAQKIDVRLTTVAESSLCLTPTPGSR